jgi:hypothetical protein
MAVPVGRLLFFVGHKLLQSCLMLLQVQGRVDRGELQAGGHQHPLPGVAVPLQGEVREAPAAIYVAHAQFNASLFLCILWREF